jgi:signal peptidase II
MRRIALITAIALLLDQVSKWFVLSVLKLNEVGDMPVWPPFVQFHMAWNKGVNFGLFGGDSRVMPYVLIALALVICAAVLWWLRRSTDWRAQVAAGLLIGGALGNSIDRLRFGAVADFLNMSCCGIENPYAFNVADIAIFLGAVGLIFWGDAKAAKKDR